MTFAYGKKLTIRILNNAPRISENRFILEIECSHFYNE